MERTMHERLRLEQAWHTKKKKDTISDTIVPRACPADHKVFGPITSCVKATISIDGGTEETKETVIIKDCLSMAHCRMFTCDAVTNLLPSTVQGLVVDCESLCCVGNLWNDASSFLELHLGTNVVLFLPLIVALNTQLL